MKNEKLTAEELQIEKDIENGLYETITDENIRNEVIESAKEHKRQKLLKDKVVCIRMNSGEIEKLKEVAINSGLNNYQTYLNFIVHQIINQKIVVKVELI
jgi:predicted DNA binding CopG/RHH family protein